MSTSHEDRVFSNSESANSTVTLPPVPKRDSAAERLHEIPGRVEQMNAPVWPLEDYVAVNPFLGHADLQFQEARSRLRKVSDAEMLLPLEYYSQKYQTGDLTSDDIGAAIDELNADTYATRITVDEIVREFERRDSSQGSSGNAERSVRTLTEVVDLHTQSDWKTTVSCEVGRYLAAHYDKGQMGWPDPWQNLSLFAAWRSSASVDRQLAVLGVSGFEKLVQDLPSGPEAAILILLRKLDVPQEQWELFLLCLASATPGWAAWTRYQGEMASRDGRQNDDFTGLLAIRLAYEAAIAEHAAIGIDWHAFSRVNAVMGRSARAAAIRESKLRYVLLRASELSYQRRLLSRLSLAAEVDESTTQKTAQMVFCIDVRSERIRRRIEEVAPEIQTYGFAGFFGVPIAVKGLGEETAASHVPAPLSPAVVVEESIAGADGGRTAAAKHSRWLVRLFRKSWKQLSRSAAACFPSPSVTMCCGN